MTRGMYLALIASFLDEVKRAEESRTTGQQDNVLQEEESIYSQKYLLRQIKDKVDGMLAEPTTVDRGSILIMQRKVLELLAVTYSHALGLKNTQQRA